MHILNLSESIYSKQLQERPYYVTEYGTFNTFPKPYKEEFMEEVLHRLATLEPFFIERRQIMEGNKFLGTVAIYWYQDTAYAIQELHGFKASEFKFYKIGCDHKNKEETKIRNNYYRGKCKDCGYEYEYDCSD